MKKIFFISFLIGLSFQSCKQEQVKIKYQNIGVCKYLLGFIPVDSAYTITEKAFFKTQESFFIDSTTFYYSLTDSTGKANYYSKTLLDSDIKKLNTLFGSIEFKNLETAPCKNCLYHGPYYTLIKDSINSEQYFHFYPIPVSIENFFEFGRKLKTSNEAILSDSIKTIEFHQKTYEDAIKRKPRMVKKR